MQNDPIVYILASGMLCGSLGFMSAALLAARTVKRAEREGWKAAVRFYQDRQRQEETH